MSSLNIDVNTENTAAQQISACALAGTRFSPEGTPISLTINSLLPRRLHCEHFGQPKQSEYSPKLIGLNFHLS
jgi:hypothetical protein